MKKLLVSLALGWGLLAAGPAAMAQTAAPAPAAVTAPAAASADVKPADAAAAPVVAAVAEPAAGTLTVLLSDDDYPWEFYSDTIPLGR